MQLLPAVFSASLSFSHQSSTVSHVHTHLPPTHTRKVNLFDVAAKTLLQHEVRCQFREQEGGGGVRAQAPPFCFIVTFRIPPPKFYNTRRISKSGLVFYVCAFAPSKCNAQKQQQVVFIVRERSLGSETANKVKRQVSVTVLLGRTNNTSLHGPPLCFHRAPLSNVGNPIFDD